MKRLLPLALMLLTAFALMLLAGCMSIPDSAINAISNAGGGYLRYQGIWGNLEYGAGNSDKGASDVTVAPGRVEIRKPYPPAVPAQGAPQLNHGFSLTPLPPGPVLFNPTPIPMKPSAVE